MGKGEKETLPCAQMQPIPISTIQFSGSMPIFIHLSNTKPQTGWFLAVASVASLGQVFILEYAHISAVPPSSADCVG